MKMLFSSPQYGGITVPTNTCHLRQDDAFVDSLPPAVANPGGGTVASQAALPLAGSIPTPFSLVSKQCRVAPAFPSTAQEFSAELNVHVSLCIENT